MFYGYIYKIVVDNPNSKFDKCYYIGKCKYFKKDKHYHDSSILLKRYKNKHGLFGLNRTIIIQCFTEKELNDAEIYYISKYQKDLFKDGGKCLNIAKGGMGGDTITNNPNRLKILKKKSILFSGENNPMYGKNYQCHGLKKRSEHLKNKSFDEFFGKEKAFLIRENISNGHKGLKHSDKTKLKMSINNKGSKGMFWWNNGIEQKMCFDSPGDNWVKGRLYYKSKKLDE